MMSGRELIFVVVEDSECGYRARALGEDICASASSIEELRENVREAVRCHFDDAQRPQIVIFDTTDSSTG